MAAQPTPDPVLAQLSAARQGIGDTVTNALGEIGRRESQATTSTDGYAPTLSNIYAGLGDAGNAPSLQILRASQDATTPLVRMGFTDMFGRQRTGLEQARLLELADIDRRQAEYEAQKRAQAEDRAFQSEQARQERSSRAEQNRLDRESRSNESRLDREFRGSEGDKDRSIAGAKADPNAENRSLLSSMGQQAGAERGSILSQLGQADALRNSPEYKYLADEFGRRLGRGRMSEPQMAQLVMDIAQGHPWENAVSLFLLDRSIDTDANGQLLPLMSIPNYPTAADYQQRGTVINAASGGALNPLLNPLGI